MERRKQELLEKLADVRQRTLSMLEHVPERFWKRRIHGFYSPIGWHFGHVGRTEEFWACHQAMDDPVLDDRLTFLYHDCPENPKDNRVNVPDIKATVAYMEQTRSRAADALERADMQSDNPLIRDGYAWEFAHQHECQHQETIAEMLCLIHQEEGGTPTDQPPAHDAVPSAWIDLPASSFWMGDDNPHTYDCEKGAHEVKVAAFQMAERPVQAGEWRDFIADGGYMNPALWSDEGWEWRQAEEAERPHYWLANLTHAFGAEGVRPLDPREPVQGVSWHEAKAFAEWREARLPTEEEWEYAARAGTWAWGDDDPNEGLANYGLNLWRPTEPPAGGRSPEGVLGLSGGVWEWTASPFRPYPGYRPYPYEGYSGDHMDGRHYACRGGSWATSAVNLRRAFRNWYVPTYRQGFLGVRLAR